MTSTRRTERLKRGRRVIPPARQRNMVASEWERQLSALLAGGWEGPAPGDGVDRWMLWEWRRVSLPVWRRIFRESLDKGDHDRQEYARWMLGAVLLDPEHQEGSEGRGD